MEYILTQEECNEISNTIQLRIVRRMIDLDESNESMAEALGISVEDFRRKIGIRRQPFTAQEIFAIARRLGVSTDYLLGLQD